MTIAGSERRWSIPLFYRRAHPVAHRGNDLYFLVAEELVGADRVFGDSRADEHLLHGLDQPRRAGDVVDVGGEALQVALEHGAVQKPGLAAPGTARLVHFDHGADEMAAGMALGERRELLEKGRILGPAVRIQQPQVAPEPRVRAIVPSATLSLAVSVASYLGIAAPSPLRPDLPGPRRSGDSRSPWRWWASPPRSRARCRSRAA